MAFQAQRQVGGGGYIDPTAALRDTLSGIQGKFQADKLREDKLKQQAIDNKYRADAAAATAAYRSGMTSRADSAEARAQATYDLALADRDAANLAGGLYSDVKTTTGMTEAQMKDPIAQAQGALTQDPAYQTREKDLVAQSEDIVTINDRVKEMEATHKKSFGGAPGMRRSREQIAAENESMSNINMLKGQAEARQKLVDEGADMYSKAYEADSAKISDDIAAKNALTSKTSSQYAKDLKADLVTQATTAKGGKGLTKAENRALDKRVKEYVDLRKANISEVTAAKKEATKFEEKEKVKATQKIRVAAAEPDKQTAATIKEEAVSNAQSVIRAAESGFGDKDTTEYKKARDTLRRFNDPYESNYWLF